MIKNLKCMLAAILVCSLYSLSSCTNEHADNPVQPESETYKGVPLVILDTDIGSSTDDLLSLVMLYRYADEGLCKLLGVVVDRNGEDYAALADLMNTYYGYGNVPIGMERDDDGAPRVFIDYKGLCQHKTDKGELMFKRTVSDYAALPDGWQLYRQLLAGQPDHSVSICSTGFVSSLAQLLHSEPDDLSPLSGVELVRQKVKCLYLMAGVFATSDEPDYNFRQDSVSAHQFFESWPGDVPMVFSPMEVGNEIEYEPELVISDIDWTDIHPIKQVYMNYNCNTGQKMWDPMVVINAVEGDALFTLSEPGIVTLTPACVTIFTPSPTGNDRYQEPGSAAWSEDMLQKIRRYNRLR